MNMEKSQKISKRYIIPRNQHKISRKNISENALKVLYRLKNAGYEAHLVGGGVRDLLLGKHPKDFDIATNARPEQIKKLFRNCRLIGRRFRLAHIHFGRNIIEVATFRKGHEDALEQHALTHEGMIVRDNVYGTIEDDAWRRDFTINALFYNIDDFSVIDFTSGLKDLNKKTLRIIGDPKIRYQEDPVRMLRAIRFAGKLGFTIHPKTAAPILKMGHLLTNVAPARLFEEVMKIFHGGTALKNFRLLLEYDLFQYLFPASNVLLKETDSKIPLKFLERTFANTDSRIKEGKPTIPAFLIASALWYPLQIHAQSFIEEELTELQALDTASEILLHQQIATTTIPRRFSSTVKDIWSLQPRLAKRKGKRAFRVLSHPRFRAAYDLLLLRAKAGEKVAELAEWWTEFQSCNKKTQKQMLEKLDQSRKHSGQNSSRK